MICPGICHGYSFKTNHYKEWEVIKMEKSSGFFLNMASLCGLVTVAIVIGIVAVCDKYLLKSKYQV